MSYDERHSVIAPYHSDPASHSALLPPRRVRYAFHKKDQPMRRWLPILMMGSGVLLVAGSLLVILLNQPAKNDAPLPSSLANQPLTNATYGDQAVADITRLHGKQFPITSGAVGQYGDSGQSTLWVSESPTEGDAADLVTAMQTRIAEGRSPFSQRDVRDEGSTDILVLDGMGQQHFYFQVGKRVIWLAADPSIAEAALQDTLAFYEVGAN